MCLSYVLTKCSHASGGQANDWQNPPRYTVITQLAFTWEIGLRRLATALLHGGNLNASCQLPKKQNSQKHSSLCLLKTLHNQGEITPDLGETQCSHSEWLLPTRHPGWILRAGLRSPPGYWVHIGLYVGLSQCSPSIQTGWTELSHRWELQVSSGAQLEIN